jgi:hypothetical protein
MSHLLTLAVEAALRAYRFRCGDEAELQAAIAKVLTAADLAFEREVKLGPRARIDFLVGARGLDTCVGLEVKVKGAPAVIARQLALYAASPWVRDLVLVTTQRKHEVLAGALFSDKRIRLVRPLGGFV